MVQVTVRRRGELESAEADVIERLVINAESLVRVLDKLVHGERRVVRLKIAREWQPLPWGWEYAPQRPCQTLWDWVRPSTCTSYGRGIPLESWRSKEFPYQNRYHHQGSE